MAPILAIPEGLHLKGPGLYSRTESNHRSSIVEPTGNRHVFSTKGMSMLDLWVIGLEQIEPRQRLNGICTEWMGHDGTNSATQRTRLRAVIKPVMVCKESTADHSAWKFSRQTFDYLTTGYVKLRKCSKKTLHLIPQWRKRRGSHEKQLVE